MMLYNLPDSLFRIMLSTGYKILLVFTIVTFSSNLAGIRAQDSLSIDEEAFVIQDIFKDNLADTTGYHWLRGLCKNVGHRLSGSPGAAAGVDFTRHILDTLGLDSVWLQPCMVTHWVRGEKEIVRIVGSKTIGTVDLRALALGNAPGTGPDGLSAEVIEVFSLDQLHEMPNVEVEGKIVFFNRPFSMTSMNSFYGYGTAVDQRGRGPQLAADKGAVAAIVRSMTPNIDPHPHTGTTIFRDDSVQVPAVAIATKDAELLAGALKKGPVSVYIRTTSQMLKPALSYNVVGEIRGTEIPEEVILVGGHLDSWDVGEGAHDDGTGCIQSMVVLRNLKRMNYKPRRTIRCVLFMNEENGLRGARAYADSSNAHGEFHFAAIESDAGGFTPQAFSMSSVDEKSDYYFQMVSTFMPLLEPYNIRLTGGGGGADISRLKSQGGMLIGLRPDSQRYFDYHHTDQDVFEAVHYRELALGSAAMTSLVYLLDKYGTNPPK